MTDVKHPVPDHLMSLTGSVLQRFRDDVAAQMRRPEVRRRAALARGLRTSQIRLLSLTPPEGLRVTDLAERVGMTKQALGEFANELEGRGLLESVRDPADRRVRILRPTPAARRAVNQVEDVIAVVEQRWRDRMGPERYALMQELLREAAAVDPSPDPTAATP